MSYLRQRPCICCAELRCWKCLAQLCQTGGSLQWVEVYWLLHLTFVVCWGDVVDKMYAWRIYIHIIYTCVCIYNYVYIPIRICGFYVYCRATVSNPWKLVPDILQSKPLEGLLRRECRCWWEHAEAGWADNAPAFLLIQLFIYIHE